MSQRVLIGLEKLLDNESKVRGWGRLGLLYNQASVDHNYRSAARLLNDAFPGRLKALFGPQHGAWITEQDNMRETSHQVHPLLGIPIFSLYSKTRRPEHEALRMVDSVIVDIQDVGTRVYTYAATLLYMMEECARLGKKVIIADRPNPINGVTMEGNLLSPEFESFVGPHSLPMRHAMTLGELGLMFNDQRNLGTEIEIAPMEGWKRDMYFEDTGLPWALPSPNMPLVKTAVVYPGQVILEGTNISEGRGVTRPFEIFGAPFIDPYRILGEINKDAIRGAILREIAFKPTFNKWADRVCWGFQIHVTDRSLFKPFSFTMELLRALKRLYPNDFQWSSQEYEYVKDFSAIEAILGDRNARLAIDDPSEYTLYCHRTKGQLEQFEEDRLQYLLYS